MRAVIGERHGPSGKSRPEFHTCLGIQASGPEKTYSGSCWWSRGTETGFSIFSDRCLRRPNSAPRMER